jgi:hypothetical protein
VIDVARHLASRRHLASDPAAIDRSLRSPPMSSIYDLEMTGIDGELVDFDRFRGQVLLIVNVASA